jgi:hypothetical protein
MQHLKLCNQSITFENLQTGKKKKWKLFKNKS